MNELDEMKFSMMREHLSQEATILGLYGDIRTIHIAQTINEFKDLDLTFKQGYSNLIGFDYTTDEELMKLKTKNSELLRIHNYIIDVLFNQQADMIDYNFEYYAPLAPEDVRKKGILFYYFHSGSATMEDLVKTYSKFELLFMTAFMYLFVEDDFKADLNCSKEGLAMNLLSLFDDANIDPRTIITLFGPRIIHNNVDCNLRNLDNLKFASHACGLDISMKKQELYSHYCLLTVNKSFFEEVDIHRKLNDQVSNPAEDFKSCLYYGFGDGFENYTAVNKNEVANFLIKNHPSKKLARRVIYILQKEGTKYQKQIDKLYEFLDKTTELVTPKPSEEWKIFLVKMFNCAMMLLDYESEMKSFNPVDYELRLGLEPTEPEFTDRFRLNISTILQDLDTYPRDYSELPMVSFTGRYEIQYDIEYVMGNFFIGLEKMAELGLFYAIANFGSELLATANYYHLLSFGSTITMNGIDIEDVPIGDPMME